MPGSGAACFVPPSVDGRAPPSARSVAAPHPSCVWPPFVALRFWDAGSRREQCTRCCGNDRQTREELLTRPRTCTAAFLCPLWSAGVAGPGTGGTPDAESVGTAVGVSFCVLIRCRLACFFMLWYTVDSSWIANTLRLLYFLKVATGFAPAAAPCDRHVTFLPSRPSQMVQQ